MAKHVCPYWVGYLLSNRLRKLLQGPSRVLGPYVKPDVAVLDVGSAMGFFSIPMARMVGPGGKVVCVDLQPKMLDVLARRAAKAGVSDRIETHVCSSASLCLDGREASFDFALAFAVLHEVPDQARCLGELHRLLKPGATLLLAEPKSRVTTAEFEQTVACAREMGFAVSKRPYIRSARAVLLTTAMT
ncbi:MAG: class I SAM-dependent methyltransferase [Sedimentisphaerales bacterium]|nr:class I SAM-dependent methyltransferase [Sedimentisphaerales bacterium]